MTKSELIEHIAALQTQLSAKDVELAVKMMLDHMTEALSDGDRIEIRGFGSFSLHYRAPRLGRNPKTGEKLSSLENMSHILSPVKNCVSESICRCNLNFLPLLLALQIGPQVSNTSNLTMKGEPELLYGVHP